MKKNKKTKKLKNLKLKKYKKINDYYNIWYTLSRVSGIKIPPKKNH